MANFSFDVVSDYDKGEMTNVLDQTRKELDSRYDFKGTSASIDWLDGEKNGFKIIGDSQYQLDSIVEIVRKKLASREQSQKLLDTSKEPITGNLKMTWDISFQKGLDQEKAKKITAKIREVLPKIKTQIQGEEIRVTSGSKDDLQQAMQTLREQDFDFPINFTNFR
ncbi:MAG: YajQ family cyclic di-GMP-binding protein [bacterium]